jgi:hypothetical protein
MAGHGTLPLQKKLTNDLSFVNPNPPKIPYNSFMPVFTFNFPLLTFNSSASPFVAALPPAPPLPPLMG